MWDDYIEEIQSDELEDYYYTIEDLENDYLTKDKNYDILNMLKGEMNDEII